jgi:phosphonate transport system ATP-binding protein
MIELSSVRVTHDGARPALDGVDLRIAPGERVALIGPSGAGKTTLLRVLGASLRPGAGQVTVLGASPWALRPSALRALRGRIGKMHQAPPIPPRQRVVTAVLAGRLGQWPLWRALTSLVYPLDIEGARAVLAPLGLAERLFDRCDALSGGQLQRVALARVLYQQPDLILADEPVSALDPALARSVTLALNDTATARGVTLVASLHAVDLALEHFSRIIGLRAGRIAFDLPAVAVTPEQIEALYAGAAAAVEAVEAVPDDAAAPRPATRLTRCA